MFGSGTGVDEGGWVGGGLQLVSKKKIRARHCRNEGRGRCGSCILSGVSDRPAEGAEGVSDRPAEGAVSKWERAERPALTEATVICWKAPYYTVTAA